MTTYEYTVVHGYWSDMKELNNLGAAGWEVYHLIRKASDQGTCIFFLRRRSDTYCEHCAKAKQTMAGLETIVP